MVAKSPAAIAIRLRLQQCNLYSWSDTLHGKMHGGILRLQIFLKVSLALLARSREAPRLISISRHSKRAASFRPPAAAQMCSAVSPLSCSTS